MGVMVMTLASALRDQRRKRDLTQERAAQLIGTSQQNYANWELGVVPRPKPGDETWSGVIRSVAEFLEVSVPEVLRLAYDPQAPSAEAELDKLRQRVSELEIDLATAKSNRKSSRSK